MYKRIDLNIYLGMTPLLAAAVTGHNHIVEYFIRFPHLVSRKEKIDALELLGATYVDKKRDMIGALEYWKRALEERYILLLLFLKDKVLNFYILDFTVMDHRFVNQERKKFQLMITL